MLFHEKEMSGYEYMDEVYCPKCKQDVAEWSWSDGHHIEKCRYCDYKKTWEDDVDDKED